MDCVILIRLHSGKVTALTAEDDEYSLLVLEREAAIREAEAHPLCKACLYQIVELDEL